MEKQKFKNMSKRQKDQILTGLFFIIPSLIMTAVFVVYPAITVFYHSFTDWNGVSPTKNYVGIENYLKLAKLDGFGTMMLATLTFAVGMTLLTVVVAFAAALILDKKGKGRLPRGFLRSAWFFPTLLSGVVVGILWHTMYEFNNGLINKIIVACGGTKVNWLETVGLTNIAIIVGATWARIGICVVIFMAGLQAIPQDLYEAAALDGATPRQARKFITIPLMAPSITINMLTTSIAAYKSYELPYLISQGRPGTTTLLISQRITFFGFETFEYGRSSALAVVLILIITVFSLLQLVVMRKREDIT
ncbi:MAG: sugar ABC transporter permease, partial [Lachnospiraceae bacterium]|nr:sugar ABC transporter permease [Lachnospiraceae bacterium]